MAGLVEQGAAGPGARRACRACLRTSLAECVRLLSDSWRDLYQLCVNNEIPESQLGEAVLCAECSVLVKRFAEFKLACEQSETFWQLLWKKKLECETLPLECPMPIVYNEKPIKIETENTTDVKDEMNSDTAFEDNFGVDQCLNEVKVEGQNRFENPKNMCKTSPKECVNTNENFSQPDTDVKTKRQYNARQRKKKRYEKGPFICDMCGKSFTAKNNLATHITRIHEKTVNCGLCQYSSNDAAAVKLHLQQHFANNDLKCALCEYEGRDFADMVGHRLQHMPRAAPARARLHACPACPRRSSCPYSAEFHFRQTHLRQRGGRCHTCGKHFATLKKWKNHEYFHDNGFQCHIQLCRKWFRARESLAEHLRAHPPPASFVCDHCGRIFAKKSNLTLHVRLVHGARRAAACGHCARVFAQPQYLARHLRAVARGRRYACAAARCDRVFRSRSELGSHARSHAAERPFECESCGRRYKRKQALTAHLKKHFGARPAQCPECPAAFFTSSELRRHRGAHSGRRRHACADCARSFHEPRQLLAHCRRAHPADTAAPIPRAAPTTGALPQGAPR